VQLNPGEEFAVEYQIGHPDQPVRSYLTLVRGADEDMLKLVSNNVLDDYINGAPLQPGSVTCGSHRAKTCGECSAILGCFGECAADATGACELDPTQAYRAANPLYAEGNYYHGHGKYEKHHLREHGSQAEADASDAGFGRIKIEPGHAAYIERPVSYVCNGMGDWNLPADRKSCVGPILTQWLYPAALREDDDRAAYNSSKYPWILSVTADRIKGDEGGWADTTLIKIPASHGPGAYVVNYHWAGYNDCIDIAVFPPAADGVTPSIPNDDWARYGYKSSETGLYKIDHCQYVSRSLGVIAGNTHAAPGLADGVCADSSVCGAGAASCTAVDQLPYRTCFAVPPPGARNSLNETRDEALGSCKARCLAYGSGWCGASNNRYHCGSCGGINVVPLVAPPLATLSAGAPSGVTIDGGPAGTDLGNGLNIPYGIGACTATTTPNR
jgi:hypothetical protein